MESKKDLHTYLTEYSQSGRIPMHMPGHKRVRAVSGHMHISAMQDFTEIDATDNLHDAQGVLRASMELAAKLWGSLRSYYLVNGSTCGILAGIRTLTKRGDKILVARNAHKSVFHAIELCGLVPVFLLPAQVEGFGICGSVSPEAVEAAFAAHPDIRLAVITSPTYEGVISDVEGIAGIVHRHNATLFVDEAHGAHLGLHPTFEKSAVKCGADLVVQSLHKTLPAFTQTAVLHVCSSRVPTARLAHQLAVFETSSPSYPLLISADGCVRRILEDEGFFESWRIGLAGFSIWATQLQKLRVFGYAGALPEGVFAFDETKLYISTHGCDLTGVQLAERLDAYKIDVEMVTAQGVLAMTGAGDSMESIGVLAEALVEIDAACSIAKKQEIPGFILPELVCAPEQALEAAFETKALRECVGAVSAEYVWAYPPGIPLLIPGERISMEFVSVAENYARNGVALHQSRSKENGEIAVIAS